MGPSSQYFKKTFPETLEDLEMLMHRSITQFFAKRLTHGSAICEINKKSLDLRAWKNDLLYHKTDEMPQCEARLSAQNV